MDPVPLSTPDSVVPLDETLEPNESDDAVQFQLEWARFQRVHRRRRDFFDRDDQQQSKATHRLFIIARNDDPWHVFGLTTRLEYRRRVYELSGLHCSRLHEACANGDTHVVGRLLALTEKGERTSTVLTRDSSGQIPLHHAVIRERHSVIRLLLQHSNARLQLHVRDNRAAPPVQYVLEKMHRLAQKEPANVPVAARSRRLYASSKRFRKLWRLADRLLHAMESGLVHEMQSLDDETRGDAWDAVRAGEIDRLKVIRTLYGEMEMRLEHLGHTLLHEACAGSHQDLTTVLFLVSELAVDQTAQTQSGATALHVAASYGWLEACVLILDTDVPDAEIDSETLLLATDARGRTPLHACLDFLGRRHSTRIGSRSDSLLTARYLVQRCPQTLQVVDYDGFTPLHYAVCSGDRSLVELMIALGANLFLPVESVPRKAEYGARADWAPCGRRFEPTQRRHFHAPTEEIPVASTVESLTTATTRNGTTVPSIACARMRRVKAGQVEHPGETVPMETLWFLMRRPQTKCVETRQATPSVQGPRVTDGRLPEESCAVLDAVRLGCRRFGAVCEDCCSVDEGHDDAERIRARHRDEQHAVAVAPLVLAIRCCRLDRHFDDNVQIVEALVLAGSPLDNAVIDEALCATQSPRLLQLVLEHSGQSVTREQIVKHCFVGGRSELDAVDRYQAMLLWLLESSPEVVDSSLLSRLFRWEYFTVVERLIEGEHINRCEVPTRLREMCDVPLDLRALQKSGRVSMPEMTVRHLNQLVRWRATWPDLLTDFTALSCTCIDQLLARQWVLHNANQRHEADQAIAAAIHVLLADGGTQSLVDCKVVVKWIVRALESGLVSTAKTLWTIIAPLSTMSTTLLCTLSWPLRVPDLHLDFIEPFVHELLQGIVETAELESMDRVTVSTCFAVACIYKTPLAIHHALVAHITTLDADLVAVYELFMSRRFGGRTLSQWIVHHNRVDVAELLFTAFASHSDVMEKLWRAFVMAVLPASTAQHDRWQALLLSRLEPPSPLVAACRSWLTQQLVRRQRPSPLLAAALDWLNVPVTSDPPSDRIRWLDDASMLHDIARWNALPLLQYFLTQAPSDQPDVTTVWSRLVSTRHDVDMCSPIDLCELLGHSALAHVLRGLGTANAAAPAVWHDTDSELPARPRHFGLLRTVLSSPSGTPATHRVSARARKIDPLVALSGDWHAAVALNDTRLLDAFSLHAIPLPPADDSESSSTSLLLETAITYGSVAALEWLLRHQCADHGMSTTGTRAVLDQAARHTSSTYAYMTLLLLQHGNVDPGRLAGDGTDVTLLHRAACFTDAALAADIFTWLLALDGSDVNVRDGVGVTPIAYALAAGNSDTVCWLLTNRTVDVRLEAEFEGQSAFYYTLQLAPSFAWRWLLRTLLITTRHAAFLHCTTDDCACKGFERATGGKDDTSGTSDTRDTAILTASIVDNNGCSFCGHAVDTHTRVPYPPWFRDQYETYLPPTHAHNDHNHDGDDDDQDDDDETNAQRRLRAQLEAPLMDEALLERDRGRLGTHDLARLTQLRFHDLLHAHALALLAFAHGDPEEPLGEGNPEEVEVVPEPCTSTHAERDSHANLAVVENVDSVSDCANVVTSSQTQRPVPVVLLGSKQRPLVWPREGIRAAMRLDDLPWFLRGDVAMVLDDAHATVPCHTTPSEQIQTVLRTWLRYSTAATHARGCGACGTQWSPSDRAVATPVAAIARWRDVTITPVTSTSVSFCGCATAEREVSTGGVYPVALDPSKRVPLPLPIAVGEEQTSFRASCSSVTTLRVSTHPTVVIGSAHASNSLSILQLFLYHWRYARVYQCFRLWKRRCEDTNAQVAHHELETLADAWAADARRARFQALVARQRVLERTTVESQTRSLTVQSKREHFG